MSVVFRDVRMTKRYRLKGEITIETAIVFPVAIILIIFLIYFTMFLHDVVILKSYGYAVANQYADEEFSVFEEDMIEQLEQIPLFVLNVEVRCVNKLNSYVVKISYVSKSNILKFDELINSNKKVYEINVERKMSRDILYATSAMKSNIREGE